MKTCYNLVLTLSSVAILSSCKKALQISPPVGTIVAKNVFSTDIQATSAADGMYFNMINTYRSFSSAAISIFAGMSADELVPFDQNYDDLSAQFFQDSIQPSNAIITGPFWANAYSTIYSANAIIEGLQASDGVHDSVKSELTGEAEFVRAFCNFYLLNLFGDIPLVTTINYQTTSLLSRSSTQVVYQSIVADLTDAKARLAGDYSVGHGQRIIPNKWAAMAMLARVYLYLGDWTNAMSCADSVTQNTGLYSIQTDLRAVFLANSSEAIWQLQQDNSTAPYFNITPEADILIPAELNSNSFPPLFFLTDSLLYSFEAGDLRRAEWVDSTLYSGTMYYFPFKYQQGPSDISPGATDNEFYMVLRLAEQHLIKAEAEAQLGMSSAITDLDKIRQRAGLPGYGGSKDRDSVLAAIQHERRVELFVEWGHRWLDLKRMNVAPVVLSIEKNMGVSPNSLLYPIPTSELISDPKLTQNPGYIF